MKSGEVILALLTDYSKTVNTIDFDSLPQKMHQLNFFIGFLQWILSYLYNCKHFVQIKIDISAFLHSLFGVPQGSIFEFILFNIYVADMSGIVNNRDYHPYPVFDKYQYHLRHMLRIVV